MSVARTLVVLLAHGDGPATTASVRSAARLSDRSVDVLVLDDSGGLRGDCAGVEGGGGVADLCRSLGAGYYRSPRSLGAARAVNLALLHARQAPGGGYGHVLLAGPGAVLPHNAVAGLRAAAATEPLLASVTAWSNDVSVYSLASLLLEPASSPRDTGPGQAGGREASPARQDRVDWVSSVLEAEFGSSSVDAPFAVGACCLISVEAVGRVGLFDPAMGALGSSASGEADGGRAACSEELDWGLRARSHGYRTVLAPGVFAHHAARSASSALGAIRATPPLADRAIELRHPGGRRAGEAVLDPVVFDGLRVRAEAAIVREAARARGWSLEASKVARTPPSEGVVQFTVIPSTRNGERATVRGRYLGATMDVRLGPAKPGAAGGAPSTGAPGSVGVIGTLHDLIGLPPSSVTIFDRGPQGELLMAEAVGRGVSVLDARSYPETL